MRKKALFRSYELINIMCRDVDVLHVCQSLPQVEEFRCLGVLFLNDGMMEREMDHWALILSNKDVVLVSRDEESVESKGKTLNFLVRACSNPHLWS